MHGTSKCKRICLLLLIGLLLTGCGEEASPYRENTEQAETEASSTEAGEKKDTRSTEELTDTTEKQSTEKITDSTEDQSTEELTDSSEELSSETATEPEELGYLQITMDDAVWMLQNRKDYILLDVRTNGEFLEGHIPGAINIDSEDILAIQDLNQEIKKLPDKDQKILIYCRSGNRSKKAAAKLAEMGYTRIIEFGGIIDWPGEVVTDN